MKFRSTAARNLDQQHVADQIEQPFLQADHSPVFFQQLEMFFHVPLGRKFRLERIQSARRGIEEIPLYAPGAIAKYFPQHIVIDEWMAKSFPVKGDPSRGKFADFHRYCGHEITKNAFDRVLWNAPDAKETKNVVDAKGIKVTTHLRKTPLPPIKAVLFHPWPIVGGKAPILAFGGEGVRRRAGLHVRVK